MSIAGIAGKSKQHTAAADSMNRMRSKQQLTNDVAVACLHYEYRSNSY